MTPLPREFYARDPITVARELLGKILVRDGAEGLVSGRIVEAEAYLSSRDSACHASRGRNRKNAAMFGPAGHAYVYMIHARWCANVVTEEIDRPSAVLIRALEPLTGIELMQQRRRRQALLDLARGPAKLCEALAITKALDSHDLTLGRQLWIAAEPSDATPRIERSRRIGVTSAHARLLRFFVAENAYVSGRRLGPLPTRRPERRIQNEAG